jgi:hypothetical protein
VLRISYATVPGTLILICGHGRHNVLSVLATCCCREGADSAQDTATPIDTDAAPPHKATNGFVSIDSTPTAATKASAGEGAVDAEGADEIDEGEEPLMALLEKLDPLPAPQADLRADMQDAGDGPHDALTADSLTVWLTQAIQAADDVRPLLFLLFFFFHLCMHIEVACK